MINGYVIVETTPLLKSHMTGDFYDSLEAAQDSIYKAATDLRSNPEQYEPGRYSMLVKEAVKMDDGTIQSLETVSRHLVILGPYSGAQ